MNYKDFSIYISDDVETINIFNKENTEEFIKKKFPHADAELLAKTLNNCLKYVNTAIKLTNLKPYRKEYEELFLNIQTHTNNLQEHLKILNRYDKSILNKTFAGRTTENPNESDEIKERLEAERPKYWTEGKTTFLPYTFDIKNKKFVNNFELLAQIQNNLDMLDNLTRNGLRNIEDIPERRSKAKNFELYALINSLTAVYENCLSKEKNAAYGIKRKNAPNESDHKIYHGNFFEFVKFVFNKLGELNDYEPFKRKDHEIGRLIEDTLEKKILIKIVNKDKEWESIKTKTKRTPKKEKIIYLRKIEEKIYIFLQTGSTKLEKILNEKDNTTYKLASILFSSADSFEKAIIEFQLATHLTPLFDESQKTKENKADLAPKKTDPISAFLSKKNYV